jgi:hypothetical protein
MANNRFQIKRTFVTGRLPNTTDPSNSQYIAAGEFAMNMIDKQLYTSNGSSLITIGSTGSRLEVSESISIGDIATQLLTINSTSIFAGNTSVSTYVNTTSISVSNSSSNISVSPTTLFVGNDTANVTLDMSGGVIAVPIVSANINSSAVVTIRTSTNHGITTVTQSKLLVSANQVSLNSASYSADYSDFGFDIRAVPTPNTITFVLPNHSFKKQSPGDRTISNIQRFSNGVVEVETVGPHLYSNGDLVYASGVGHILADFYISGGSAATIINPTKLTYTQNAYASTSRSLIGSTALIYTPLLEAGKQNPYYFWIEAQDPIFNGFYTSNTITYVGLPSTLPNNVDSTINAFSPSAFNGNHTIYAVQVNRSGFKTILVQAGVIRNSELANYLFPLTNPYTLSQGAISISFVETGRVNNNSLLCPVLPTSSIDGYIVATKPTGISLKNGSKLVYVLDDVIFVGNSTIGNIVDSRGSRAFRPDTVTIEVPTFNITPNKYYMSEGDSVTFTITTTNYGSGLLFWTNIGTTIGSDFADGLNFGMISIENDSGSFTLQVAEDVLLEGPQSIQIELRTGSTTGDVVATTFAISVSDTSFPPTYSITPDKTNMNEGQTVTYQVETTGVPTGTTMYWTNSGTTTGADFIGNHNSGSFIVNAGVATIVRQVSADLFSEELQFETIILDLRIGSDEGTIVATAETVYVNDSSVPYYNVTASTSNVNEGSSVTFTIVATGIAPGTTIYWSNEGTTLASDFTQNVNNGSIIFNTSTKTVQFTVKNDYTSEGIESIIFRLRSDSVNGNWITEIPGYATTASVTVNDTSIPVVESFTGTASPVNEGSQLQWLVNTIGFPVGTTLYWSNEGTTTAADFTQGINSGTLPLTTTVLGGVNYGTGTISLNLVNDFLTEFTETVRLRLRTGSTSGTPISVNGLSGAINVTDTSIASQLYSVTSITPNVSALAEGQTITFTVVTQNVPNGTYLYWENIGTTSASDFTDGKNSDRFIVNNNIAVITRTLRDDAITEGIETVVLQIRADSISGSILRGSITVSINDLSTATYSVSVSTDFVNEGASINFDIGTTNVAPGTKLYWDIVNPVNLSSKASDFTDNVGSGQVTLLPATNSAGAQFDGISQYLWCQYNSSQDIGGGNFSIEAYIYPTSRPTTQYAIIGSSVGVVQKAFQIYLNQSLYISYDISKPGNETTTTTGTSRQVTVNTWNHIALVRNNGVIKIYVNGVADDTVQNYSGTLQNYNGMDANLMIGAKATNASGSSSRQMFFQGYMTNVRFITTYALFDSITQTYYYPSAKYTENFTPSTSPLLAEDSSGVRTALLALQGAITDNSSYRLIISNYGGVTMSTFSPFLGASAIIQKTLLADRLSEGPESAIFRLFTNSTDTIPIASSSVVTINDTSVFIQYGFVTSSTAPTGNFFSVSSGGGGTYIINTRGPINGVADVVVTSWSTQAAAASETGLVGETGYIKRTTFTGALILNSAGLGTFQYNNTQTNRGQSGASFISMRILPYNSGGVVSSTVATLDKFPWGIKFNA